MIILPFTLLSNKSCTNLSCTSFFIPQKPCISRPYCRQLFKLPAPEIELLTLRLQGQCFTPTPGELTNLIDISKTLNFRAVSRHAHRSSRLGCLSSLTLGNINNGSKKQNIFVPVSFSLTALQSHLLLLLLLERTGIHEFQYCCLPYFL